MSEDPALNKNKNEGEEPKIVEDYPSRGLDYVRSKTIAHVDGKPSIVESALEHRTGIFLTSILVYDSIGHCLYSETMDLPKECEMSNETKTLHRDEDGLPTLIRRNQLGENFTQGLTRILTEQATGEPNKELKVLSQQQTVLEWDENKRLKSTIRYQLVQYKDDKEFWAPESVETFKYDNKGRLVEKVEEEFSEDGHYIKYYYTYNHDQVAGHNRVINSWYTNDNYGADKAKNILNLHTAHVGIYDPDTHERLLFLGYVNTEITSKIPVMGPVEPIYVIKPEHGGHLVMKTRDIQRLIEENDVRALRLIADGLVPESIDVPIETNLSNHK